MAMLIFYALTYTKIYLCLTRHLNVDTTLGKYFIVELACSGIPIYARAE